MCCMVKEIFVLPAHRYDKFVKHDNPHFTDVAGIPSKILYLGLIRRSTGTFMYLYYYI